MPINWAKRRRDVDRLIKRSPWECTVYRRGLTPDDEVKKFSFTGTLMQARMEITPEMYALIREMGGEHAVGRGDWVVVAPYDIPEILHDDLIDCVSPDQGYVLRLRVAYAAHYESKWEIMCHERQ